MELLDAVEDAETEQKNHSIQYNSTPKASASGAGISTTVDAIPTVKTRENFLKKIFVGPRPFLWSH